MAASKLSVYNDALLLCEERRLASLTENREPRHLLDQVWDNGGVRFCLEQAQWKFAMRSTRLDYLSTVTPDWGFRYAFEKPSDWVVTSAVCSDEYFSRPLLAYVDEVGYWWADLNQIYVRFVSDDDDFGLSLGRWPTTFADYVAAHFAYRIVGKLSGDRELSKKVKGERKERKTTSKNKDAAGDPARYPASSAWNRSRRGQGYRNGPYGDGGSGGTLIG